MRHRIYRAALVAVVVLALGGCGGSTKGGVTISPGSPVVAKPEGSYDNAPPITKALVREWATRWCEVQIGDPRKEVTLVMGSYPTDQNSHMLPLIPQIHLNAQGENVNQRPPIPAGSDTWAAPGAYLFNAFYDPSLHVQQLDYSGPASGLDCAITRIR